MPPSSVPLFQTYVSPCNSSINSSNCTDDDEVVVAERFPAPYYDVQPLSPIDTISFGVILVQGNSSSVNETLTESVVDGSEDDWLSQPSLGQVKKWRAVIMSGNSECLGRKKVASSK